MRKVRGGTDKERSTGGDGHVRRNRAGMFSAAAMPGRLFLDAGNDDVRYLKVSISIALDPNGHRSISAHVDWKSIDMPCACSARPREFREL
jgi:hypothetical protein